MNFRESWLIFVHLPNCDKYVIMRKNVLIFLLPFLCFAQKQYNYEHIKLNSPYLFYEDKRQEQEWILSIVNTYFSEEFSDEETKATFWKNTENEFDFEGSDLFRIEKEAKKGNYTPTVLSMFYINEKYLIRMAWIGNTPEDDKILSIYNFLVNKKGQFENVFENQINTFTKKSVNGYSFYYKNPQFYQKKDVKKALKFSKQMADFFEIPEIKFQCYIFDSYLEQKRLRGFDFDSDMRLGNEFGGVTFPYLKMIFSGNRTAYYPHEIVHLYTNQKAKNKYHFIDEGIATYFGGTSGLSFSEIMQDFQLFLQKESAGNLYTMLDKGQTVLVNHRVDFYYVFSALLCHTVLKYHGKEKLFELLDSDDDWEEFLCKIEALFDIQPTDFHSFFLKETENYLRSNRLINK